MTTKKKASKKKEATKHIVEIQVKAEAPSTALVPTVTPDDLKPMQEGGKYMIPKTWMSERQALVMMQRTPAQYVQKRPAKGGGMWDYVPGWYVQKVLNFVFGWNWDFEVPQQPTVAEVIELIKMKIDQVWVTGKLTVKDNAGHTIVKTQVGRADIKFRKGTRDPLDIGNDLKAAMTDALKKCASELGIASDIYGKHESKDMGYNVSESAPQQPAAPAEPKQEIHYECFEGAEPITPAEAEYSKKMYGRPLCREHQKGAKRI